MMLLVNETSIPITEGNAINEHDFYVLTVLAPIITAEHRICSNSHVTY